MPYSQSETPFAYAPPTSYDRPLSLDLWAGLGYNAYV